MPAALKPAIAVWRNMVGVLTLGMTLWGILRGRQAGFGADLAESLLGQFLRDHSFLSSSFYVLITLAVPVIAATATQYSHSALEQWWRWRRISSQTWARAQAVPPATRRSSSSACKRRQSATRAGGWLRTRGNWCDRVRWWSSFILDFAALAADLFVNPRRDSASCWHGLGFDDDSAFSRPASSGILVLVVDVLGLAALPRESAGASSPLWLCALTPRFWSSPRGTPRSCRHPARPLVSSYRRSAAFSRKAPPSELPGAGQNKPPAAGESIGEQQTLCCAIVDTRKPFLLLRTLIRHHICNRRTIPHPRLYE